MTLPPPTMNQGPATIQDLLESGAAALRSIRPDQADSTVLWGLSHILQKPRNEILMKRAYVLSPPEQAAWKTLLDGLLNGEPLQYLTGETQFMDLVIACDQRGLIPRPETEQLVEWVLNDSSLWKHSEPRLADIGTGTGCISLALAHYRPQVRIHATDRSAQALTLAKKNAAALGLSDRIQWHSCDVTAGLKNFRFHAIVSNPPYIAESDWKELDASVRDWEPKGALVSGMDGLDCIRQLIAEAPNRLLPGGALFMEIGENQEPVIAAMLTEQKYEQITFRPDLAGRVRMVRAEVPK